MTENNQEKCQKCPECYAYYTGKHSCDGLMKMLVDYHNSSSEQEKLKDEAQKRYEEYADVHSAKNFVALMKALQVYEDYILTQQKDFDARVEGFIDSMENYRRINQGSNPLPTAEERVAKDLIALAKQTLLISIK